MTGRPLLSTAALIAAAVLGLAVVDRPVTVLAAASGVLFVATVARSLFAGLVVFTLLSFFSSIPPEVAAMMKVTGGVLAIAWIPCLAKSRSHRLVWREHLGLALPVAVLCLWALGSTLWARDQGAAVGATGRLLLGVVLFIVVFSAVTDGRKLRSLALAFVAGATMTTAVGLAVISGMGSVARASGANTRFVGGLGDPNQLAAGLIPAIALGFFILPTVSRRRGRALLTGCLVVLGVGLALTQSRGGLISLAAMFCFALLVYGQTWRRLLTAAAVAVAVVMVAGYYALLAPQAAERIFGDGGSGRTHLWRIAWEVTVDRPLLGVGAGNFRSVAPEYLTETNTNVNPRPVLTHRGLVHNAYLEVQAELGIMGFGLFAGLISGCLVVARRSEQRAGRAGDWRCEFLARGIQTGTVGLLAANFVLSGQYGIHLWMMLGLAAASSSLEPTTQTGTRPCTVAAPA